MGAENSLAIQWLRFRAFVLPVQRTWVQSLLGAKIPRAAMRPKKKKNNSIRKLL